GAVSMDGAVSIADAERPNFAEDPTSRIVPPGVEAAQDHDRTTMTVMNMERPPDELADEEPTTPIGIPSPRRAAKSAD
ncbi:hypothetical protein, partial [Paractinoplanes rishiriensis]|uniref:hypothetical protein n=1 Tax=Paractinoplanes rishiriensis TaxID=1050105 RepID=UPI0019449C0E